MPDSDETLRQAVDQLYAIDPEAFMDRRRSLVTAAKTAGETDAAKHIGALRKPTRSAYIVNRLVRAEPELIGDLTDLGGQMRRAERSVDAAQIRDLTARRRRLVDELATRAFDLVGDRSPSAAVRDEVVSTLTAALADADLAEQVVRGTLVKPARWEGFGFGGAPDLTLVPPPTVTPTASRTPPPASSRRLSKEDRDEARRRAADAEAERKAKAQAEAGDAKRAALEDAQQAIDESDEAVILATDDERARAERLRDLEEQVSRARRELDQARVQVRRAEIRQRRARDALRRLGG